MRSRISILLFTASDFTFTTRYIHSWVSFPLWPSDFILYAATNNCPPLFPSSTLDRIPSDLGTHLQVSYLFVFSYCPMGFSRKEYWSGLPFLPPLDHVLPEQFTMTHPSWVALYDIAHSFIELPSSFSTTRLWCLKVIIQKEWSIWTKAEMILSCGYVWWWKFNAVKNNIA